MVHMHPEPNVPTVRGVVGRPFQKLGVLHVVLSPCVLADNVLESISTIVVNLSVCNIRGNGEGEKFQPAQYIPLYRPNRASERHRLRDSLFG
jgi:hypothetical protein